LQFSYVKHPETPLALSLHEDASTLINTATYAELADVDLTGRKSYCIQKLTEINSL